MSARWRRSQRSKRFDILKVFKKGKCRHTTKTLQKSSRIKWKVRPYTCATHTVSIEKASREPKPLIDILENENEISVVAEFAGYNREDLRIDVKDQRLTLSVEALDRRYRKSLNLPSPVIPSTLCTTYKNGVLEIRVKKAAKEKTIDKLAG